MWAADNMNHPHGLEILKILLEAKAYVNENDKFGRTAFDRFGPIPNILECVYLEPVLEQSCS
jgi:hypothetical protein